MANGFITFKENGSVSVDSTVRFTRFKGTSTVAIGGQGSVVYFTPSNYVEGDIILPIDTTAPFVRVEYEPDRVKLTNIYDVSGTVTFSLIGFL